MCKKNGNKEDIALIHKAIEEGGLEHIDEIMQIIVNTDSLNYTADVAKIEIQQALNCLAFLPNNDYKKALISLAQLSISRTS